jgi:hypothetical protein
MARFLADDTSEYALQHRFRSIKKDAADMLKADGTALRDFHFV